MAQFLSNRSFKRPNFIVAHRVRQLQQGDRPVLGERIQLQQMIFNLVMNGIEAMDMVTDRPRRWLFDPLRTNPIKCLSLCKPLALESIYRISTRSSYFLHQQASRESGWNSRSVARLIGAHGGRLWATANHNKGTTFQFSLPTGGGNQHD